MKEIFDLTGKTVVLTGGLGFLGKSFVKSLLNYGANLVVLDIVDERFANNELASCLSPDEKNNIVYLKVDITSKKDLEAIREKIIKKFGRIDVLINNAALNPAVGKEKKSLNNDFETYDLKKWNEMFNVNVTGTMLCCQVFGSEMRKGSSIVNIASIYGVLAPDQRIYEKGFIKPVSYTVTKGAVIALTKYLAAYWGYKGIRTNVITPGGVISKNHKKSFIKKYSSRVPLKRMAKVDDLCGALIYLCSDASSYVNGENIIIDGGMSIW